MQRITGFIGRLASCVCMLAAPAAAQETVDVSRFVPQPAPQMRYSDESGAQYQVSDSKARLTAVHFWAVWCVPCVEELPEVDAAQAAYGDKGFKVLALSLDGSQNAPKVRQFLAEHGITHLTPYFDADTSAFKAAGIRGLPATLFIDGKGQEIARAEGPLNWKSEEVKALIEETLK